MKKNTIFLVLPVVLALLSSCTRTANKTGPLTPYPEITADIDIGEQVRGQGTRAELLGFIRWGDPGRATFEARPQENDLGGKVDGVDHLAGGIARVDRNALDVHHGFIGREGLELDLAHFAAVECIGEVGAEIFG